MPSLMDKLKQQKEAAANQAGPASATATAKEAQLAAAHAQQAQPETEQKTFEITEAQIKQNAAYKILTDTSKYPNEEARVNALIALKSYNKDLTKEQNAQNLKAFNEFLLYSENQLLAVAKKANEFTNDEAFSFFDKAVQTLKSDIGKFTVDLIPMVKALEVLQRAREAKIPAGQLLDEVKKLIDDREKANIEIEKKKAQLQEAIIDHKTTEKAALGLVTRISELESTIKTAETKKLDAEGTRTAEEAKYFFSRNKEALERAKNDIREATQTIDASQRSAETLKERGRDTAEELERKQSLISAVEAEINTLETQAQELDAQLKDDEDTAALSKLLEITGEDYKNSRGKITTTVNNLLDNSVKSFDKSMERFQAGRNEVSTMNNTVINIGEMMDMCAKADAKVRAADTQYIGAQETIVKSILAEKGEEAVYDPTYVIAREQQDQATIHSKESLMLGKRVGELDSKLTIQKGTYIGLIDSLRQQEMSAQRLRTNAAVDTSSKLLITTKSLEMAMAGENVNTVDDMLAELSETTNQAVSGLFNTLSQRAGADNERATAVLQQNMAAARAMDSFTKEMRTKAKEGTILGEATRQARQEIESINKDMEAIPVDAEREAQNEGLKAAGAARVASAAPPAPPRP